jgi:hypothetical protein
MTPIHSDLEETLDAAEVVSPTRYTLLGTPRDVPDANADEQTSGLEAALAVDLYQRLYLRPGAAAATPPADDLGRRDLVAALSAANSGRGTWESGWSVRRFEDGGRRIAVAREGLVFWVDSNGLRVPGGALRPGAACRVRVDKEMRNLVPGFYVALGDAEEDRDDPGDDSEPLVRYYWHLTCESAAPLVREAATRLNAAVVPFVLKVRNDPAGFRRADAGVLFVRRRYLGRLGDTIEQVHAAVAAGLRPEVPLFTMWLGHGLAMAEDPGGGQSFGQHRCGLAARALWRSFLRGDVGLEARARTMADAFLEIGLDPARPFLGPGAKVAGANPWDRD